MNWSAVSNQFAARLIERVEGHPVNWIERDAVGASNATFFARLATAENIVARLTPPEYRDLLAQEVWAMAQCRARGVPVPEVRFAGLDLDSEPYPFLLMARLPGVAANQVVLTPTRHEAILEELGHYLALIHQVCLTGFGALRAIPGGYAGRYQTASDFLLAEFDQRVARIPSSVLPRRWVARLRETLAAARSTVDSTPSVLIHGDYHLKNVLVHEETVTGIVDFENLVAGDPVLDFKDIHLRSDRPEDDVRAMRRGYGQSDRLDDRFWPRLYLYEVPRVLEVLVWHVRLGNRAAIAAGLAQLTRIELTLGEL